MLRMICLAVWTDLISDNGLFDGCEVLEGGEEDMAIGGAADIFDEAAELFAESYEDFVFVFDGL